MEGGPSGPGRATKRATKGDAKPEAKKKPAAKTEEGKGGERRPDGASEEPKPLGILAPEQKASDTKANAPAAGDAKPAEGGKKPEEASGLLVGLLLFCLALGRLCRCLLALRVR